MIKNTSRVFMQSYSIEWNYDWEGKFPLVCTAILFDILNIHDNIVVNNHYSAKSDNTLVMSDLINVKTDILYQSQLNPRGEFSIWIKQHYTDSHMFLRILELQGSYMSCMTPSDSFCWEWFLNNRDTNEIELILSNKISFICSVVDEDKYLHIYFNLRYYSVNEIEKTLNIWEDRIKDITKSADMKRVGEGWRNNSLIRLIL